MMRRANLLRCIIEQSSWVNERSHDFHLETQFKAIKCLFVFGRKFQQSEANWFRDMNYNSADALSLSLFQSLANSFLVSIEWMSITSLQSRKFSPRESIKWKSLPSSFILFLLGLLPLNCFLFTRLAGNLLEASNAFEKRKTFISSHTAQSHLFPSTFNCCSLQPPASIFMACEQEKNDKGWWNMCVGKQPMGWKRKCESYIKRYID